MGGVSSDEAGFAGWWVGTEIAADIAGGELERAETGDLEVGEILANAAFFAEHFLSRCADVGGFGIELKVAMDTCG